MRLPPILTVNPISTWAARRQSHPVPTSGSDSSTSPRESVSSLPPPAYNVIVHGPSEMIDPHDKTVGPTEVVAVGSTPSGAGEEGVDRPVSTKQEVPDTPVLVMVREDYLWARAYIRDMDYKVALRKSMRRVYYKWYLLAAIIIVITILMSVKHTVIVEFLHPVTKQIRSWPGGFLIPIALLIVVSFPPLMGHELIGLLCGLVWGLSIGFGILAAGTFLGEIATWIAFKWCCTARAQKFEKKNKLYASLTQLIREKSFMFVLILRFSAVPGHITTAVSASAGADFWSYLLAAFLTLPKQLVIVYLGTAFGQHSMKNTIISWVATGATFVGTIVAAAYIYYQMRIVLRRKALSLPTTSQENLAHAEVSMIEVRQDEKGRNKSIDVFLSDTHNRRPWMPTDAAADEFYRSRDTRSRSLPGPVSDAEMRQWINSIDSALVAQSGETPAIRVHQSVSGPSAGPSKWHLPPRLDHFFHPQYNLSGRHELSSIPQSPLETTTSSPFFGETTYPPSPPRERRNSSPTSPTIYGNGKGKEVDSLQVPDEVPPMRSEGSRATVSLDIERPKQRQQRPSVPSGRDIADDADQYALAMGGKRPDLSRLRGESRAALLGRPDDADSVKDA